MRSVMGSAKRSTRTHLPTRCESPGSAPSSSGGIVVVYGHVIVGQYTADLIVEDQVIVELKPLGALNDLHVPQSRHDLQATGKPYAR
jgi:GxxExxY protein